MIFWLACVLTLVPALVLWLPRAFGCGVYYISTPSMEPALPKGSLVFTKPVSIDEIVEGEDILAFKSEPHNKTFIHRCVSVDRESGLIYTKGDANEVDDPLPTDFSLCYGRLVFHLPVLGYLAMAVDNLAGKLLIAALYVVWLAIEIESRRSKKLQKDVKA